MGKVGATDLAPGDGRSERGAAGVRASAPAKAAAAPKRRWSARRTLLFIVLASCGLWAAIIALIVR